MRFKALSTLAVLLLTVGTAQAVTVVFDDIPFTGNAIQTHATSTGYNFDGGHFHILDSPGGFARNASTSYLTAEKAANLGQPVTMTKVGGGTFTLNQVDVAELWLPGDINNDFFYVYITANQSGGGTFDMLVTLDGIRDGAGGADDFQLVNFAGWTNLTDVTFTGRNANGAFGDYSIDNIVVDGQSVPEPASLALLALGSLALLARGLRKQ